MEFFTQAVDVLKILVTAIGAGLGAWGVINLLEGYGNDITGHKTTDGRGRDSFNRAKANPATCQCVEIRWICLKK